MSSILSCFLILFISVITLAQITQPSCRNGAIGCANDMECITYTSPASYCLNYSPHTYPYVCQGCGTDTGCCSLTSVTPPCTNNNNLIVNGGFEAPVCASSYCFFSNIDGWIVLSHTGGIGPNIEIDNNAFVCHSGLQCSDMASDGDVNIYIQSFPTNPGNVYNFSFWEAANPECSSGLISVSVVATLFDSNGVVLNTGIFPFTGGSPLTSPSNLGWTNNNFIFTATTIETTLVITGTTQFLSCGPILDDVSVICTE